MGHHVHPKAFRIREIGDWDSRGFYGKKFPEYLEADLKIREFLKKKFERMTIEKIEIERFHNRINVIISSARPGLIIGRGGGGVEELKKELESKILGNKGKTELRIEIREVKNPWASAPLVGQWMALQIEKRVPYRRVLKGALNKIMSTKGAQGAKVLVAGRLNGVEISRTEWLKKGKLPRQTIRADIDYNDERALCTYGIIGIKVWIYKGERF